jgi:hypothetical protein
MVMSGPCVFNSQSIFQDVGYHFMDHTTIEHHLDSSHNDFKFQEINFNMPIYDFDDITQVPFSYHDLGPVTQVDASVNFYYIISATTCAKEILVNKSQPSCNIIVHSTNIFLSTLSLDLLQYLMDIHPYFYEIWFEGIFQERINKFLYMNSLVLYVYKVFIFSSDNLVLFSPLLLMFYVYICTGLKEFE